MIPESLYITPYYWNAKQNAKDKWQLSFDSIACYDTTDPNQSLFLINAWTKCQKIVNAEAKFVTCMYGQLFLDTYLYRLDGRSKEFEEWVKNIFLPTAKFEMSYGNNHAAWGLLAASLSAHILGLDLKPYIDQYYLIHSKATGDNGEMINEIKRTYSGIWYSYLALAPMLRVSQVLGTDPWFLYSSLNWLWQYVINPDSWPYEPKNGLMGLIQSLRYPHSWSLERPQDGDWPHNLYHAAGTIFNNDDWLKFASNPPYGGVPIFRDG